MVRVWFDCLSRKKKFICTNDQINMKIWNDSGIFFLIFNWYVCLPYLFDKKKLIFNNRGSLESQRIIWSIIKVYWISTKNINELGQKKEILNENEHNRTHWLVCFSTTLVTCVGCDGHHGFDLRWPGHDAPDLYQLANPFSLDVAHWQRFLLRGRLEVNLTEIKADWEYV